MMQMPFKPRAQILLQLGEQLIKNENIAILELVKNAYDSPSNVYEDIYKTFEFYNLVKNYNDDDKYRVTNHPLKNDPRIMYIWLNINGECETAQNKYPVIRVMPGLLIP